MENQGQKLQTAQNGVHNEIDAADIVRSFALTTDMSEFEDYLIDLQLNYLEKNSLPKDHKVECNYFFGELRQHLKRVKEYQVELQRQQVNKIMKPAA